MKKRVITVFPGDGIGPEVVASALRVLEATGIPFEWDRQTLGQTTVVGRKETTTLSPEAVKSLRNNRVALKGPTATPLGGGHRSLNVALREEFKLFANVRPIRTMLGVKTRFSDVPIDILIFRENLEDLYIGMEITTLAGAEAVSRMTYEGCNRIASFAFKYAQQHSRHKVTVMHKANILKMTHGVFLSAARHTGLSFPKIQIDDLIADNCMMQLVRNPERFDCILAPNLLGDLVSDLAAGLVGGLGFAPGANIGEHHAVFEAVHGTAPDIAGKGIANPTAMVLSGAMLLDHLHLYEEAERVRKAVNSVLLEGVSVTKDVNSVSGVSTEAYTDAVIAKL